MAAELALVLVERGATGEARLLLGDLDAPVAGQMLHNVVLQARAALAEAEGRRPAAVAALRELGARLARWGLGRRPVPPWRSQAARLLGPQGRALAAEELRLARAWGGREVLGIALRGTALVAEPVDAAALEASVAALEPSAAGLELARSLTELGADRRRAGARSAAREPLRRALELAHRCGAAPLAERARAELLATGARPRRFAGTGVEALTPSERRVCDLAAIGRSNGEIAAELYVTVNTVETHLRHAFQKLGIRSRREISPLLAENLTGAP
jgi:DNA-binding CsgD family transcriptional regulator